MENYNGVLKKQIRKKYAILVYKKSTLEIKFKICNIVLRKLTKTIYECLN
jgi:hypothetical protein